MTTFEASNGHIITNHNNMFRAVDTEAIVPTPKPRQAILLLES